MKNESPAGRNQDEMESLELSPIRNDEMHSQQQDELEVTCELIKLFLATYGSAQQAFQVCAANNAENITLEEFSSVMQNFEQFNSKEVISKVFQQLNPDGNGTISAVEWENAFKSLPHRLAIFQQNSISHNSDLHHITIHKEEDEQVDEVITKEEIYEQKQLDDKLKDTQFVEQQTPKKNDKKSNSDISNQDQNSLSLCNTKDGQNPQKQSEVDEQPLKEQELKEEEGEGEEVDKPINNNSNPSKYLEKLSNSSGIEGLVIKCNALKVHALAQQTYSLNQTAQRNRTKQQPVSDTQVQEIFGSDLWNDSKKTDKKNSENSSKLLKENEVDSDRKDKQQVIISSDQHIIDTPTAAGGVEAIAPLQNYFSNSNNSNNLYQISSQAKPSRDMKTNFASYLSLIGLGQSRGAHNNYNNIPGSISLTGSSANRVLSSEKRGSFLSASKANKPRNGLEGMIDQINNKKDSLLQKKKNNTSSNNIGNNTSNSQVKSSLGLQRVSLRNNYDSNSSHTNPVNNQSLRQREKDGSVKQLSLQRNFIYSQSNTNFQTNKDLSDQLKKSSTAFTKITQSPQQTQTKSSFISLSKQLNNRAQSPTQGSSNNSKTQVSSLYFSLRPSSNSTTGIQQPLSQENRKSVLLFSAEKQASPFMQSSSVERSKDLKQFEEKLCTPQKKERQSFHNNQEDDKKQKGTPKQIYGLDEFEDYNEKEMNTQGSGYGLAL